MHRAVSWVIILLFSSLCMWSQKTLSVDVFNVHRGFPAVLADVPACVSLSVVIPGQGIAAEGGWATKLSLSIVLGIPRVVWHRRPRR